MNLLGPTPTPALSSTTIESPLIVRQPRRRRENNADRDRVEESDSSSGSGSGSDSGSSHDTLKDFNTVFQLDPEFDISTAYLIKVFNQLDKDKNGKLSYQELYEGLMGLWRTQDTFSEVGLRKLIEEIDTDMSGDVTQAEFVHFLQEFAARNTTTTGVLHEAFYYDYSPGVATCKFITMEGGPGSISLKDFVKISHTLPPDTVRWVHMAGKNASAVLRISNKYHLTQLEIEDILNEHEHPKINTHPGRLHILVNEVVRRQMDGTGPMGSMGGSASQAANRVEFADFSIFLVGENTVLSFSRRKSDIARVLLQRIVSAGSKLRLNNARFLVYSILDTLVDNVFIIIKAIEAKLEAHRRVAETNESVSLENITSFGYTQGEIDRIELWFAPMMAVVSRLLLELTGGDDTLRRHIIDLQEHVITQKDMVTRISKWAGSLNQIFVNEQQFRMNRVMYVLTIITSIFVPGQFMAGVYGMNFVNMPELRWKYGYLAWWIVLIVITIVILSIFRVKGWFKM